MDKCSNEVQLIAIEYNGTAPTQNKSLGNSGALLEGKINNFNFGARKNLTKGTLFLIKF